MAHTAGIGAAITIEHGHDTINIVTERVAHQRKQARDISDWKYENEKFLFAIYLTEIEKEKFFGRDISDWNSKGEFFVRDISDWNWKGKFFGPTFAIPDSHSKMDIVSFKIFQRIRKTSTSRKSDQLEPHIRQKFAYFWMWDQTLRASNEKNRTVFFTNVNKTRFLNGKNLCEYLKFQK